MADLPSCADCGHKFKQGEERVIDFNEPPDRQYCTICKRPDGLTTMSTTQYREHFQVTDRDVVHKRKYAPMSIEEKMALNEKNRSKDEAKKREKNLSWEDKFVSSNLFSTMNRTKEIERSHGTMPKEGSDPRIAEKELKRIRPNYDATDDEIKDWNG